MSAVFNKLNLKNQKTILALNVPESFSPEIEKLDEVNVFQEPNQVDQIDFFLAFVKSEEEIAYYAQLADQLTAGDAVIWFAYPKKASKKYKVEIDRDHGWKMMDDLGLAGVRQVAIDEDWSALRFRRTEFIGKR